MIYTGYVVQNDVTSNVVKVWCPYRDGVALFKKHKGFGGNTGNLKIADLNPSEERGIVLIGMEFFKYPRTEE